MHYNLLNYGNGENFCTNTNNNIDFKEQCLRTIISYTHPEIVAVNEMKADAAYIQRFLDNVLNIDGIGYYQAAQMTNFANATIINAFYYDSRKIGLRAQDVVLTQPRDINIYKMYLKTNDLATQHDTIFFYPVVAHLKAGATSADETQRLAQANQLMQYLSLAYQPANFFLSGDFNFYSSSEAAFQIFTNYSDSLFRFHDPLNLPGSWNSNASFASIHTQSTHRTTVGCAASGGLDDRFDFILVSQQIMSGAGRLRALPETYKALGQDGQHFNLSINEPPQNPNAPQDLADALYGSSDHLPVLMDLVCDKPLAIPENSANAILSVEYSNPCSQQISLKISTSAATNLCYQLIDNCAQIVLSGSLGRINGLSQHNINVSSLKKGYYTLRLSDGNTTGKSLKIIIFP